MFWLLVWLVFCDFAAFVSSSMSIDVACSNQTYCQLKLGEHSTCTHGNCSCENYYFLQTRNSFQPTCVECPGIGESCETSQCCNQEYLVCHRNVCMCIYSDYCWSISDSERERFQHVAQCILAVALILTATILFILFWKACTRRSVIRRNIRNMSTDSFLSLNSIQRLVLLQLQDRPPPYNTEYMPGSKIMGDISEPPPSYIEAVGLHEISQGEDNIMFFYGELSSREDRFSHGSASGLLIPCHTILSSTNNISGRRQSSISVGNTSLSSLQNIGVQLQNNGSGATVSLPLPIAEEVCQAAPDCDTHLIVLTSTELHI